ncbi:MAG: DUF1559 domain-containing protein [Planctomycetota bacterium]|nr:DUF1559 domain-containing protein [Planctomycetota bacterium]
MLNNFMPSYMECPSSPLPRLGYGSGSAPQGVGLASYMGVSGATNWQAVSGQHGIVSNAGILVPGGNIRIRDITDGTTNVIMIGEQSDWGKNGTANIDIRSGTQYGCWMGCDRTGAPNPANAGAGGWNGDNRTFNLTTVRYAVGYKTYSGTCSLGTCTNHGSNKPIQSAHTGGAQVCLGDGSVRFVTDNLNFTILQNLANRNDGNVIPEW